MIWSRFLFFDCCGSQGDPSAKGFLVLAGAGLPLAPKLLFSVYEHQFTGRTSLIWLLR